MKVLLTGGTGFLGQHTMRALSMRGLEVIGTYRKKPGAVAPGVRWRHVDVLDIDAMRAVMQAERPTHLLHMAWRNVHGDVADARDNIPWLKASLDLAEAFIDTGGQRIVVSGSCFEYDWSEGICIERETLLEPSTLYGSCKNALRAALAGLARTANVSFAWPRIFFSYGPGEHSSRFVNHIAGCMLNGAPAEMTMGAQVRDFVYAGDVAEALALLLLSQHQGEFNIASGAPVTLREIAEEIAAQTARLDLLRIGARQPKAYEPPHIAGDTGHTTATLGWRATTPLSEGIARTIAALRTPETRRTSGDTAP